MPAVPAIIWRQGQTGGRATSGAVVAVEKMKLANCGYFAALPRAERVRVKQLRYRSIKDNPDNCKSARIHGTLPNRDQLGINLPHQFHETKCN